MHYAIYVRLKPDREIYEHCQPGNDIIKSDRLKLKPKLNLMQSHGWAYKCGQQTKRTKKQSPTNSSTISARCQLHNRRPGRRLNRRESAEGETPLIAAITNCQLSTHTHTHTHTHTLTHTHTYTIINMQLG